MELRAHGAESPFVGEEWDPSNMRAAVLEIMADPETLAHEKTEVEVARDILKQAVPQAALRVVEILNGNDKRMALQAAKILLDRGLGQVLAGGDWGVQDKDVYQQFMEKCATDHPDVGNN
jgi:hypothetical protein